MHLLIGFGIMLLGIAVGAPIANSDRRIAIPRKTVLRRGRATRVLGETLEPHHIGVAWLGAIIGVVLLFGGIYVIMMG